MRKTFPIFISFLAAFFLSACAATPQPSGNIPTDTPVETAQNTPAEKIVYRNTDYGFTFDLPASWEGYQILTETWEGVSLDNPREKFSGPKLLIRNPLWSEANPYQDIPILVLAHIQWDLIQQEKLAIGAAPIPPNKLGENDRYVFALPEIGRAHV
jgi:hypothetical protein